MGRSDTGSDAFSQGYANEVPEHWVTVKSFALDKYEVTVARFTHFLLGFDAWRSAEQPNAGIGESPNLAGSGWQAAVDGKYLAANAETIVVEIDRCISALNGSRAIATDVQYPVPRNCVAWPEARAFCAWDGGWLPTEAEWEFAAVGGDENRLYPWGNALPNSTALATYNRPERFPTEVGFMPDGDGRYGHADLAGSLSEWAVGNGKSLYSTAACADNCGIVPGVDDTVVVRGGDYSIANPYQMPYLRAAARDTVGRGRFYTQGFRCARSLPR
jgi:formylglycine-generating enzyme required for sulfatase activity